MGLNSSRYLISGVLIALIALALTTDADAQDRIRLTNGEWAPYLSKNLPHFGAASHIVVSAFAVVGVEVEYGFYPWKRSYKLAREGTWNGTLVWVYTPARAVDFDYSDVVISDPEYLFHLKTFDLQWKTIEDLRGLSIGATLHTVYPTLENAEALGILTIERAGNYDTLYHRLLKARIHAIPQVSQVGRYYLRTTLAPEARSQITYANTIVQERNYHLILSKKVEVNKQLLKRFNNGLKMIRDSGQYAQIIEKLKKGAYDK